MNDVADGLLRRPDLVPTAPVNSEALPTVAALSVSVSSLNFIHDVRKAYAGGDDLLRSTDHIIQPFRKS